MKKHVISLTALLILIALCASVISCGSSGGDTADTAATTAAVTEAETTADPFVADELPELDYDGAKVNWLVGDYFNAYWADFWAETETGSAINDTVFAVRRNVEERLNVSVSMTQFTYSWSENAKYYGMLSGYVLAGDNTYHTVAGSPAYSVVLEGDYFFDLGSNPYIDLEKPWWNQSVADLFPSGVVYFLPGDGSLSLIKHTFCVYVNLDNLAEAGFEGDIYEHVLDGKWTLDSLSDIIKGSYRDLNGDQKADVTDFYGLTFGDTNKYIGFMKASGCSQFVKNSDGTYTMMSGSERTIEAVQRWCALVNDDENVLPGAHNTDAASVDTGYGVFAGGGNYASRPFMEDRSIFAFQIVGDAPTLFKDTTFKYGMIPYPKLDEEQPDYMTSPQRYASFAVLGSCTEFDMAGAVLEAWSSECYRTLQPEYFETTLKVRYSADNSMAAVFDILRNNLTFELGEIFGTNFKMTPAGEFKNTIINNNSNWASTYAKHEAADQATLDKLTDIFSK